MLSEAQKQMLQYYNEGLALYKKRDWDGALASFRRVLEIIPDDGPSRLYIDRIEAYKLNPPADDWDGVFVFTTK